MGVWQATYADLMRSRYSALVAYASLLVGDAADARELAQESTIAVFSRRRAPRDTGAAERAARGWMAARALADGAAAERVAAVNYAIDGRGPELPAAEADALRRRYLETAAVYALPSGGVNTVVEPARRKRRASLIGAGVGAAAALVGVGAVAYGAVTYLPLGEGSAARPTASGSPSPSPTMLAVTWNPEPEYRAALQGFHMPECGETFAPAAHAVGGMTPKVTAQFQSDPDYGDYVSVQTGIVSDDKGAHWVLADPSRIVVTLDNKVVYVEVGDFNGMDALLANAPPNYGGSGFSRGSFCDARVASDKLSKKLGNIDLNTATMKEQEAWQKAWDDFNKQWREYPPGTYRIYVVTPLVFGEQAALGQVLSSEGIGDLQALTWDISYTQLAADERVAPYCTGDMNVGDWQCNVPASVLADVLTRQVDPSTVVDVAPEVGISEPIEYTR